MGNAPAKLNSATVCDGGNLSPNGIYAEDAQDFDVSIVQRLILGRQLAPFYVGADDPDPAEPAATADGEGSSSAAGSGGDSSQCANDDGWWSYNLMLAQQQQQLQKNTEDGGNFSADAASGGSHSRQLSSASSVQAGGAGAPAASDSIPQVAVHTSHSTPGTHPSSPSAGGNQRKAGFGHGRKGSGFFHRLRVSSSSSHHRPTIDTAVAAGAASATTPSSPQASQSALASPASRHERSFSDLPHAADTVSMETCRRMLRRYVECPICFLYYPQNINYTRCCHKPVCTECFAQIKRKLEDEHITSTHCPYCVEPNFGVIYYPPSITTGAARTNYMKHRPQLSSQLSQGSSISSKVDSVHSGPQLRLGPRSLADSGRSRSQSVNSREPIIVMSDDIRPMLLRDLNGELERKKREQQRLSANMASVAAATQRISARNARAAASLNGDSSDSASGDRSSRGGGGLFGRSRRQGHRAQPSEYSSYVEAMRAAGETNLEEFLIQEAIRMSLAEQEQAAGNNGGEASPREASAEEAAIPEEQETENQACQTPAAEVGGNRADEDDSSSSNSYPASGDGDANHENHAAQETGLTVSDSLPVLESSQTTLAGASPAHTVQINTSQTSIPTSTQVSVPASPTVATAAAATTVPTSAVTAPSSPLHDPLTFDAAELDAIANVSSRRRGPSASNHGLQVVTSRTATPAADATPATADSGRHRDTLEDLVSIAVEQARTSPTRMHQRQNTNPFINAAVMSSDDAAQFDFPALLPQAAATPSSPRSPRSPPPLPLPQSATTLHSNSKSMSNVSPVQSPRFSLQDPFGLESIAAASTSAPHSPPPRSRRRPPPPPPPASTSARGRAKSASHTQSDKPTPVVSTAVVSQQAPAGAATPAHSSSTTAAAPALILL